jgi:hypothetical protein
MDAWFAAKEGYDPQVVQAITQLIVENRRAGGEVWRMRAQGFPPPWQGRVERIVSGVSDGAIHGDWD